MSPPQNLHAVNINTYQFNSPLEKILQGGNSSINEGSDGLQRLDKVVATAEQYGIKLIMTLTNNWNPERTQPPSTAVGRRNNNNTVLPRGTSSNDYGGMDMYVRNFHPGGTHDLFYTDPTITQAFKTYISNIVPRYANSSTILAWELANDLRCSSTAPASSACDTHMITNWVADLCKLNLVYFVVLLCLQIVLLTINRISNRALIRAAGYIKSLDANHLVTAG